MISITDQPFDAAEALKQFETLVKGAGAIVSFTGLVRPETSESPVERLHLQAYSPMTETGIAQAAENAQARWDLIGMRIIHRIGDMSPGDPIVFVATASAHRRAAFEAADFLMDYLKTEAVFWKKETSATGMKWIEPRDDDYRDRARWNESEQESR